jgi:hypothetical protein
MSAALHLARRRSYGLNWKGGGISRDDYTLQEMQVLKMGQTLWVTNAKSVQHRYPDMFELPGPIEDDYVLTERDLVKFPYPDLVQLLKSCDCLAYQSSEIDDGEETESFRIIAAIQKAAWQMTDEYDKAEWGAPERKERAPLGL